MTVRQGFDGELSRTAHRKPIGDDDSTVFDPVVRQAHHPEEDRGEAQTRRELAEVRPPMTAIQARGGGWLVLPRQQHLEATSDIDGSGGAPRRATAWETEARSVLMIFARIVNTEEPRT